MTFFFLSPNWICSGKKAICKDGNNPLVCLAIKVCSDLSLCLIIQKLTTAQLSPVVYSLQLKSFFFLFSALITIKRFFFAPFRMQTKISSSGWKRRDDWSTQALLNTTTLSAGGECGENHLHFISVTYTHNCSCSYLHSVYSHEDTEEELHILQTLNRMEQNCDLCQVKSKSLYWHFIHIYCSWCSTGWNEATFLQEPGAT